MYVHGSQLPLCRNEKDFILLAFLLRKLKSAHFPSQNGYILMSFTWSAYNNWENIGKVNSLTGNQFKLASLCKF